jgi:hypothetical protein
MSDVHALGAPVSCISAVVCNPTTASGPPPACQKVVDFLTALSAEHFEFLQNAITEKLDKSSFSTAVYLI